jgi:hypothetical protein
MFTAWGKNTRALLENATMALLIRIALGLLVEGCLLFLVLHWSWWLTLFAVLGFLIAVAARYFHRIGGAIVVSLVVIGALGALGWWGVLPTTVRRTSNGSAASCTATATARVIDRFQRSRAQYRPPSVQAALDARRLEVQRDASLYLFQAKAAIDVDVVLTAVRRILDLQSAPGLEDARRTVNAGAEDIRTFLNEKDLSAREARTASFGALSQRVADVLTRLKRATRDGEIKSLASALFEADNDSEISQLAQKMFSLEEALRALTRQSISTTPWYEIEWDGSSNSATYREVITVRSLQDALLDSIDASLLQREADSAGVPYTITLLQDDGTRTAIGDPEHILVQPRSRQVKLVYDRAAPVSQPEFCASAPMRTIQRARFIWPSSAASIRLTTDIAKGDQHLPVWFLYDRTKSDAQTLASIRLPANSVFATARSLDLSTRDGQDVLTASHPDDLLLRNFDADRNDWVEAFSSSWILRNGVTRKWKDYLVVENVISAIAVSVLSGILLLIFPTWKASRTENAVGARP